MGRAGIQTLLSSLTVHTSAIREHVVALNNKKTIYFTICIKEQCLEQKKNKPNVDIYRRRENTTTTKKQKTKNKKKRIHL